MASILLLLKSSRRASIMACWFSLYILRRFWSCFRLHSTGLVTPLLKASRARCTVYKKSIYIVYFFEQIWEQGKFTEWKMIADNFVVMPMLMQFNINFRCKLCQCKLVTVVISKVFKCICYKISIYFVTYTFK